MSSEPLNTFLCGQCGNAAKGACLCQGSPAFYCNDCYWVHIRKPGSSHCTLSLAQIAMLDTKQKLDNYLSMSDNLQPIESILQGLIVNLDEYENELIVKSESAIEQIRSIVLREQQKINDARGIFNLAKEQLISHVINNEQTSLISELLEVYEQSGSEFLEDRLFNLIEKRTIYECNQDTVKFYSMLKTNDLMQVIQNPGMLSEEPTIPQELFDDNDNPNASNKFYTKINEPFEVVNDIKYLYHVQCYVNQIFELNCKNEDCKLLEISNIQEFPRWPGSCFVGPQKIFICGGNNRERQLLRSVYVVDCKQKIAIPIVPMRQKRSSPAVINHQGSVYVFGGRKAFSCWMIECEMFSRENNIWIPLKSLAKAPQFIKSIKFDENILIFGTQYEKMNIYSTEHDSYEVSKLPIRMPKEQFIVGVIGEDMILITRTRVLVINIVNGKFHEEHLNHRIMCKSQMGLWPYNDYYYVIAENHENGPAPNKIDKTWRVFEINPR